MIVNTSYYLPRMSLGYVPSTYPIIPRPGTGMGQLDLTSFFSGGGLMLVGAAVLFIWLIFGTGAGRRTYGQARVARLEKKLERTKEKYGV